ncbi:zinc finger protein 431-like [Centruroides sculpturatus]|uniref:zinc finger protein 431-like n=1 Tax=Centruroides sculpturatus TaxID=218467 RepID=UPI000C6D3749|nr:zinc finger protein 431-like [Centruroides sculpturatus]XP_023239228.1 zinc finger protein 431-like [Centruroides sculpturatus]
MKIKVEPENECSEFIFNRGDEKFLLKNYKKEFNTDTKTFCRRIKSEPLEHKNIQVNTYENLILTNNTSDSNIWSNSYCNSEIDCKNKEIKKEKCDTKNDIKSECKVVLKRLNFKVKTEYEYEDLKPVKNEFFIPDRNSNRNDTSAQIKQEESEEYDSQQNSKIQKKNKSTANKTKFVPSIRKYNKIQGKIKRKYFRVTRSSHSKQNHKCDLCKQTFVNKRILQAHLYFHIGKKPFSCTTCNQKFSWQFLLRRHKKEHNTEKQSEIDHRKLRLPSSSNERKVSKRKYFRCDISDKLLNTKGQLEKHNRTHQPVSHCCKICKKEFQSKSILKQHELTHSEERPFKCDICDKGFKKKGYLKMHRETHSDECKQHSCHVCNKSFKTKHSLTLHKILHNKELKHSCQICNKYFKTKRYLRRHENTHKDKSDKNFCNIRKTSFKCKSSFDRHRIFQHQNMFRCGYCNKSFKTKNMLEAHKKIHIEKCNICKKEFSSKRSLNVHQRFHFDIKPFVCEVCNRRFVSISELKRHQSSHNKDSLRFVCDVCKKGFYDKSHLFRHRPAHQRKKHFCSHCKVRFKTESRLKLHMQFSCLEIHPKRLPYQCNICKRIYVSTSSFERHLLAYNNQIHFFCDVCKTKFTSKVKFQTHQKTAHHPGGNYKCEICNKTFRRKIDLNRHIKINTDSGVKKCDVCGKKFCSFISLKLHVKSHF